MSNIDQTGCLVPHSQLQGRYIIRKTIGEGGMGSVYKAADTQARNRLVAIKEMGQSHYQNPARLREAEDLFRREAEILSNLSHANLPRVYAFFNENGRSYLVMDFIRGKTLGQLLIESETHSLPVKNMLDYALQLCDVLSYLHQQTPPIIFRDLKPGNVMVTAKGNVYLIDFGIARVFKQGLLQDTQRLGTPGFASPEQYGSGQTGPSSDLYNLGAMLHSCLTGKDPRFNQPTLFHFLPAHKHNPEIPLNLSQLIERLVATSEDQRPPNAETVRQELLSIQEQSTHTASNATNVIIDSEPKIAFSTQFSLQIIRYTRLLEYLGTWWTSTIVPLVTKWTNTIVPSIVNMYATLCAWFLLTFVPRSKQLYHNSIRTSSSWATELWQSLSTPEVRLPIREVWTPHFTFFFVLSAIATTGGSLFMRITLHYPLYLIAFYICLFLFLEFGTAYTNQRIRHPLARSILMAMTLLLLFVGIALFVQPEVQPIIRATTFNQLLSLGIVLLITVSLLRPKDRFGWVDHVCLATFATTYALLLGGTGIQVQQQWLAVFKLGTFMKNTAVFVNYMLICGLCAVALIELSRRKYPFTGTDRLLLFIVALIATPLQFFYGLQEITHLLPFMFHAKNTVNDSIDIISFNTLLTGIPVIIALLWLFIAPSSSYLSRLPLLPLALTCTALQSFLGSTVYLPLLQPPTYSLASSLDSIIHLNQLTIYSLALVIGILLCRWQHLFKGIEQFSLFYVAIACAFLQSAAWNIGNPFTSASVHLQSSSGTTITQSQLYLLAINKFLTQALILIIITVLTITISSMFLHLAREFAWVDRQIVRVKQHFNWLDQLVLRLNHLILLVTSITSIFLLQLYPSSMLRLTPIWLSTISSQLITFCLLICCVVALIRISRPFSNIDRWLVLINAIACALLLSGGYARQIIIQNSSKITSVKPWLADPHITLPPQAVAFGLLLAALVSLMWVRRRVSQVHRNMLKIGFGLTLVCAALQWLNPAFLLAGLIMLTLSVLLAIQVEQV